MDPLVITLRPIDDVNRAAVIALSVAEGQRRFIATNARTLEQAAEAPEAWLRAIYANETPVGLVLLHDEHLRNPPRETGYYFLWRLMIDARHQGLGYGKQALDLVVTHVRTRPHATRLLTSCLPGEIGPEKFYLRHGFIPTGQMIGEDIELALNLS